MKTITQKALSLILTLAMLFGMVQTAGVTAFAATDSGIPSLTAMQGGSQTELFLDSGNIVIDSGFVTVGGEAVDTNENGYIITQKDSNTATRKTVSVQSGAQSITLKDVNIDVSSIDKACAFSIEKGAEVNLTLQGENTLKSGRYCAGLQVPGDKDAQKDSAKNATLTITGSSADSLTVTGGEYGAGIGDGNESAGGTITIKGGTVTATGGERGAGIGGADNDESGAVTISGGTVTATGGEYGAGIGGGHSGAGGTVTIIGTNTKVTAKGQKSGKDIGSGAFNATEGGSLTVGDADTADGPTIELQSAGTNAAAIFKNCTITGTGANADIKGAYDANGKIRLNIALTAVPKGSALFGNPVTLTATLTRVGFGNTVALEGKVSFTEDDTAIALCTVTDGKAQAEYIPADGQNHALKAIYTSAEQENYAMSTATVEYSADKKACAVKTAPTASNLYIGSKISTSTLSGGEVTETDGTTVSGSFAWANPNTAVSSSGEFEAVFVTGDSALYNTVSVMVTVTATEKPDNNKDSDNNSNDHSNNNKTDTSSAGSKSSTVTTTNTPAGGTVTTVATQADTTPTVQGDKAIVTATVPADVTSVITSATAEKPAEVQIAVPTASIIEQLQNSAVQTVGLTVTVPTTVANNTNANAKVIMNAEQSVLQAAKDAKKDVRISVVDSDTGKEAYSWTFKGADLASSTVAVKGVDLALSVKSTTEVSAVNAATQGNKGLVLSFANNGVLPSAATVKIYAADKGYKAGQILYLYYFNPATKQFEQVGDSAAYTVDANGFVSVIIPHCSDYVLLPKAVRSITLDTTSYTMAPKGRYQIGSKLMGAENTVLKVYSTNNGIATVTKLANANYQVTGKASGTVYIMYDVYDNKNKLLTHASVKINVVKGAKPFGSSTRQVGVF